MNFDPNTRRIRATSFIPKSVSDPVREADADLSTHDDMATPLAAGSGSPSQAALPSSLLPDLSAYDLTVGEAPELFTRENRKRPSDRTLQRYCQDGRFDCYKLKTTRSGTPVHEWIINSTSLLAFIHTKPEADDKPETPPSVHGGDAIVDGDHDTGRPSAPHDIATPNLSGDAVAHPVLPRSADILPDDTATPTDNGDAGESFVSRVELLIENAKLTARLDALNDLIGELRQDKGFMREQITHQRKNDTLMADMHRETLHTLKAVSVAGRHTRIEVPDVAREGRQGSDFFDVRDGEQPQTEDPSNGVY